MTGRGMVPAAVLAVLAAATLLSYRGSLSAPFHFDDSLFLQSSRVTDAGAWLSNLDPGRLRQWTYLTFHWNYRLAGADPASYHAVNLGLHLANVLLLWLVLRLMTARRKPRLSTRSDAWFPLVAAGIFALHPIQSEAVIYVYQRSTLLAGFFVLLTSVVLLTPAAARGRPLPLAWGVLGYALAIASKESAVIFPAVAIAYILLLREKPPNPAPRLGWKFRPALYFVLAMAAGSAWALLNLHRSGESTLGIRATSGSWNYALAQVQVFAAYLRLILWPTGQSIDHAFRPAHALSPPGLACAALLAGCVAAILRFRRKDPMAAFLGLTFLLLLAPTSSVLPSADLMFEHRLYLPMLAGSALMAWLGCAAFARLPGNGNVRRSAPAAAALSALLLLYAGLTWKRVQVWGDNRRLWQEAIARAPWNPRAHYNLAVAWLETDRQAARNQFAATLELQPDHAAALYNLGWLEQTAGKFEEARDYFVRATRADPANWQAHHNLANVYVLLGKFEEAEASYAEASRLRPTYWPALLSRATLQVQLGRMQAALDTLKRLREQHPDLPDIPYLGAYALLELNRFTEAAAQLDLLEAKDREGAWRDRGRELRERIRRLSGVVAP